jgi:hypothetical protein
VGVSGKMVLDGRGVYAFFMPGWRIGVFCGLGLLGKGIMVGPEGDGEGGKGSSSGDS